MSNQSEDSCYYKLILTSMGLNQKLGADLIKQAIIKSKINMGKIFLISNYRYIDDLLIQSCLDMGFDKENIFCSKDYENSPARIPEKVDIIYVTEGNVFAIMNYINMYFKNYILTQIRCGANYVGSSAGALIASLSISEGENFDRNDLKITDYDGLGILPKDGNLSDLVLPHLSYSELKCYVESMSDKEKYRNIYNVANNEALIFEVYRKNDICVELMSKKRIRL